MWSRGRVVPQAVSTLHHTRGLAIESNGVITGFPVSSDPEAGTSHIDRLIIVGRLGETAPMPKQRGAKRGSAKSVLRPPDLDHPKTSVLQSLGSVASKRTYSFAINDFITWYCSESRLAFGRTVVLR
jgi:hypothetical protein